MMPGRPKTAVGCGTGIGDHMHAGRAQPADVAAAAAALRAGSGRKVALSSLVSAAAVMSPATAILQAALHPMAAGEVAQIAGGDRRRGWRRRRRWDGA